METDLDRLIDDGTVLATGNSMAVTRDKSIARNSHKPIGPEPGEPELLGETAPVRMGGFQRRIAQRAQAQERRVAFARALVASGWDIDKALQAGGYNPSPKAKAGAVHGLLNHPDVTTEVLRLRMVLEQQADVATIDLAKEWVHIASSNVFDFFNEVETEEGVVALSLKPKKEIPKSAQKSVKSIKVRRRKQVLKDGTEIENEDIEVTLWDKQAALDSLAKIQGLYTDKAADAMNNLAMKIAERTEKHRKRIGNTLEGRALEPVG